MASHYNPNRSGIKADWCINPGCQVIVAKVLHETESADIFSAHWLRDCRTGEDPAITKHEALHCVQHKWIHNSDSKTLETGKLSFRKDRETWKPRQHFILVVVWTTSHSSAEHCSKLHTVPPACLLGVMCSPHMRRTHTRPSRWCRRLVVDRGHRGNPDWSAAMLGCSVYPDTFLSELAWTSLAVGAPAAHLLDQTTRGQPSLPTWPCHHWSFLTPVQTSNTHMAHILTIVLFLLLTSEEPWTLN